MGRYNTEIGAGLGTLSGSIWRVGLMGYNSTPANVFYVLSALEEALVVQGFEVPSGAGLAAAQQAMRDGLTPS